jgi:hypothetical protein
MLKVKTQQSNLTFIFVNRRHLKTVAKRHGLDLVEFWQSIRMSGIQHWHYFLINFENLMIFHKNTSASFAFMLR